MQEFEGNAALITGGASGIGMATATELVAKGCKVALADRDAERLEDAKAAIGAGVEVFTVDVADEKDVRRVVADASLALGGLDVLVCSAGVLSTERIEEVTPEQWTRTLDVNLLGTFWCARAAIDAMDGSGSIVFVSSTSAQTGGLAAGPAYVASKAAVMGITRSLALSAGPRGVRVNCVSPGLIDTAMTDVYDRATRDRAIAATPVGRLGQPEDVAHAIAFLASDAAQFIHGTHLDVNGGMYMAS